MACFTIHPAQIGDSPSWYQLECAKSFDVACCRARQYGLDNGGYVCVKDLDGRIVFGTDPVDLDRAILNGRNRHFTGVAVTG